ncbi:S1 family peptidase [Rhodococcus kronopolitis]|uniref:S1 family peptidase n=1 Tax=Rhodococcus kronopolitis TaxID=1460226 RepID=A0ABV9FQC4_9NOCA
MRLRLALRAAILASATILPVTAIAQAAPEEPVSTESAQGRSTSAEQLPDALVEAIARDLKLTPEQYLDRAELAQDLSGYAQELRQQRPDTYAGSWIGHDGVPVVAVTSTETAEQVAKDGYATKMAAVSANHLEGSLAVLNQWILGLPRDVSSQINSTSVDLMNNRIVIDVVNSPIGRALNLPTLLAQLEVVLSPGGGGPVDNRAQGGDTYVTSAQPLNQVTDQATIGVCSFGFNAVTAGGEPYNISAGHCDPKQENAGANASVYLPDYGDVARSRQIGTFTHSAMGDQADGLDYALIKLNEAGIAAGLDRPTVRGANGTTVTVTGTARPVVGAPICKSGQTSTFTCGIVVAEAVDAPLFMADGSARLVRGFAGSTCTLSGDSGGAILTGTRALGITSGSNSSGAPNCTEANLVLSPEGGTASIGIPIEKILADANATVGKDLRVRTAG